MWSWDICADTVSAAIRAVEYQQLGFISPHRDPDTRLTAQFFTTEDAAAHSVGQHSFDETNTTHSVS